MLRQCLVWQHKPYRTSVTINALMHSPEPSHTPTVIQLNISMHARAYAKTLTADADDAR